MWEKVETTVLLCIEVYIVTCSSGKKKERADQLFLLLICFNMTWRSWASGLLSLCFIAERQIMTESQQRHKSLLWPLQRSVKLEEHKIVEGINESVQHESNAAQSCQLWFWPGLLYQFFLVVNDFLWNLKILKTTLKRESLYPFCLLKIIFRISNKISAILLNSGK